MLCETQMKGIKTRLQPAAPPYNIFTMCGLLRGTSRGGLLESFEYPSIHGKIYAELGLFMWVPTATSLLVSCPFWHVSIGLKSI